MRQRGFSLVELMVTLSVLGLIVLMALPSLGTWLDNTRIRNVADSIQDGLQQARAEAVRRNQPVAFWLVAVQNPAKLSNDCTLSNVSGSWVVSVTTPAGHCADLPSATVSPQIVTGRAVGDAGGRVSVTTVAADSTTAGNFVTFNGFGRITDSNPLTQINVTGVNGVAYRNLRVALTATGSVRLCDPATNLSASDPRKC